MAEEAAVVVPWSTVWVTLVVSFVVGLMFYALFASLRKKHAAKKDYSLLETRQYHYADRSPAPFDTSNNKKCLGWAIDAYNVSDDETLRCIGLDSFMFLRFLRLGFRVSAVGTLLGCIILMPIYGTGNATGAETEEFNSITLANVQQGSPRLWAAAVCWTLFVLFCLSEIDTEWLLFKPKRYDFLAHGNVDTDTDYKYAVIVENIPEPLRSNHALREYFESIFPGKIRQTNVLLHAEKLESLVSERQAAIEACEKAVAFTHAKPDDEPPETKVNANKLGMGGTKVNAIEYYESEIKRLDTEVDTERATLCKFADEAHLHPVSTQSSSLNNKASKFLSSLLKSGKANDGVDTAVVMDKGGDDKQVNDKATDDVEATDEIVVQSTTQETTPEVVDEEEAQDIVRNDSDEIKLLSDTDASDEPSDNAEAADTTIHEGETSSTGFVTFTSLVTKQAAIQCEISGKVDDVDVAPAPIPASMVWKNALMPLTTQRKVSMGATCYWLVGILFWAVPVAFVTGIANLNSILQSFGLQPLDSDTFYYGLISGILPVIALQLLMLVVYLAIGACAMYGIRCKSMPEVDAYTFFWYQMYQFANLFLILIGGSLFNQIDALIKNADPGAIAQLLATALPGASAFFLNMVIMGSFLMYGVELSMIASYGLKLVMNILQPEALKTQRMLDDEKKPPSIVWGKILPPMLFIVVVTFVYMPIVPIMEPFAMVYFGGWYIVWKHQCLHVYNQEFEGGGLLWSNIFSIMMACLYTAEVVVIAYLGLKESIGPTIFSVIPFACTLLIHYRLRRNTIGPMKNLSLQAAAAIDLAEGELAVTKDDEGPTAVAVEHQLYGQPCLKASLDEREPMPYRREEAETAPSTSPTMVEV